MSKPQPFKCSTSTVSLGLRIYDWKRQYKSHLGVLLHACKVLRVILLGWFTLVLWLAGWLIFLSSEDETGTFFMPTGVEGKSLLVAVGVLGWRVGVLGSVILLGGVPSVSLEPGETTLCDWLFFTFFSVAPGVLTFICGFSFSGIPSSSFSKVTNEQYPSVEEIARKAPSLDLFEIIFFPLRGKVRTFLHPSPPMHYTCLFLLPSPSTCIHLNKTAVKCKTSNSMNRRSSILAFTSDLIVLVLSVILRNMLLPAPARI